MTGERARNEFELRMPRLSGIDTDGNLSLGVRDARQLAVRRHDSVGQSQGRSAVGIIISDTNSRCALGDLRKPVSIVERIIHYRLACHRHARPGSPALQSGAA